MSLNFKEKRALQKIVSESQAALRSGDLGFKEKRAAQKSLRDAMEKLGASVAAAGGQEQAESDNEHLATLRSVISGALDSTGVVGVFERMRDAIHALRDDGLLDGEVEALAGQALTHWGELEASANA